MAVGGLNMARDAAKQIIKGRRARNRPTNIERSVMRISTGDLRAHVSGMLLRSFALAAKRPACA
jgi:hypothetical protein